MAFVLKCERRNNKKRVDKTQITQYNIVEDECNFIQGGIIMKKRFSEKVELMEFEWA